MKSKLVCTIFCVATAMFMAPAWGQDGTGDVIRPDVPPKILFTHTEHPLLTVPWLWHPDEEPPTQPLDHIAGLKFTIKYDPYEVAIRGIRPAEPMSGFEDSLPGFPGFSGHLRHSTIIDWPDSGPTAGPFPQGDLPSEVRGTVWVNTDIANNSGLFIQASHPWQFMNVDIEPRHTSNYQLNSDVDIVVSNLQPIYHVTQGRSTLLGSVWIPVETGIDSHLWEHVNNTLGVPIPNSVRYFRGPLTSNFSQLPADDPNFPKSGLHGAHIEVSDHLHINEPLTQPVTVSGYLLPDLEVSVQYHAVTENAPPDPLVPQLPVASHSFHTVVLHASDFTIGLPVGTSLNHFGLGIDHIPEPASLTLLGLGAVAALMRLKVQRRRRRAA